ncbi:MAG: NUDIX domain-containing protein [Candidatus Kerfeldbacteria bacterium]|nr:NUDIX domain-containing protein [Candidatus Kerfeldbacteria bacterium]
MVIEEEIDYRGEKYRQHYEDADSFADLPYSECQQVYGICFYGDKLVIAYNGPKQIWGLTGGHIESGELFEQTLHREIREEANMEILSFQPLGWKRQTAVDGTFGYELRYACAVRPYGAFERDPASRIVKIALIDPADYKQYFDWGKITDYLIKRAQALILKNN